MYIRTLRFYIIGNFKEIFYDIKKERFSKNLSPYSKYTCFVNWNWFVFAVKRLETGSSIAIFKSFYVNIAIQVKYTDFAAVESVFLFNPDELPVMEFGLHTVS